MISMFVMGQDDYGLKIKLRSINYASQLNNLQLSIRGVNVFKENSFKPCYPNAINPELLKFYSISLQDSKENVISYLNSTQLFESIVEEGYVYTADCSNPLSINDVYIVNNYVNNDALNLIEANCAWSITTGDPNISIDIADTELDDDHEDLVGRIANISGVISDKHPHGTNVVGCAAVNTNNNI